MTHFPFRKEARMATIRMDGISKSYAGRSVLSGLSLTVNHGECFTLLGPSGCGKTVLLRLIAGFEHPDAGSIRIGGDVVSDPAAGVNVSPDSRGLGVVFQDYAVWPHMTVFQNVAYPLKIAGVQAGELDRRVMDCVALVGMKGLERRLPSELSGGQQQRVALARALVANPSLMLLDEPLSNLDANLREEMRFEIRELQRKLDITVLYVTHDQEIALAISDRMAVLDAAGGVRQIGTPTEIFENPADSFVFTFMGIANFLPVRCEEGRFLVGGGRQPIPWAEPAGKAAEWTAGFRPSDVRIGKPSAATPGRALAGVVRRASFLGAMTDYLVEVDGATLRTALETHEALAEDLMFAEGDACSVAFNNLHWFDRKSLGTA